MTIQTRNDDIDMQVKDAVCVMCGAEMVRINDPDRTDGLQVARCKADPAHRGYKLKPSGLTREGPQYMANALEKRSPILGGYNVQVILSRLLQKWEKLDMPQAAMFLSQCQVLGLDPFMGEIAALAFKEKNTGKVTMQPMITGKGWALLAAKTEPDEFMGPPDLNAVTDAAELRQRRASDEGDITISASGTKRSWGGHRSTVVSTLRAEEWKGSKIVAVAEDPYHHAETRAERRWYEKNYPAAAAMERESFVAQPSEELRVIIEGEYRVLPEGTTGDTGEQHDWLVRCPEDGAEWFQSDKMREPGHKTGKRENNKDVWHNLGSVISARAKPAFQAACEQLQWDNKQAADWLKESFKGPWSSLKPVDQISAMEMVNALARKAIDGADEAAADADSQAAGGPNSAETAEGAPVATEPETQGPAGTEHMNVVS